MAEWFKAVDLKSIDGNTSASSNLACRAIIKKLNRGIKMKTSDWISVKTDLPKIPDGDICSSTVWVYDEQYEQMEAFYHINGVWYAAHEYWRLKRVTHWMPLPEDPPKEKTE